MTAAPTELAENGADARTTTIFGLGDRHVVLEDIIKPKAIDTKTTTGLVIHQETKADVPARLVYPPLDPGMPSPTKPEFQYSEEDADNDGAILKVEDDQYTFVALLE